MVLPPFPAWWSCMCTRTNSRRCSTCPPHHFSSPSSPPRTSYLPYHLKTSRPCCCNILTYQTIGYPTCLHSELFHPSPTSTCLPITYLQSADFIRSPIFKHSKSQTILCFRWRLQHLPRRFNLLTFTAMVWPTLANWSCVCAI